VYFDALSFLEDERDAWRPFEALLELDDGALSRPVEAAHGWSGRDLIGHLVAWQEIALAVARELAVGEESATIARIDQDWDERGGDAVNEALMRKWAALSVDEVRRRFATVAGELRGYLTVVPETRWVKHPAHLRTFLEETIEHYEEHRPDLDAILAAARGG
jgi:hypothetical protein